MQSTGKIEGETFNLFQAIIEQAPDAMIYADRSGTIRIWNRGAEAIFGYATEEVLGKNLDVIIPERFRRAHWDGFNKAIETGQTRHAGQAITTRSNTFNAQERQQAVRRHGLQSRQGSRGHRHGFAGNRQGLYGAPTFRRGRVLIMIAVKHRISLKSLHIHRQIDDLARFVMARKKSAMARRRQGSPLSDKRQAKWLPAIEA
jgi:PAS domain S-box-containing protein